MSTRLAQVTLMSMGPHQAKPDDHRDQPSRKAGYRASTVASRREAVERVILTMRERLGEEMSLPVMAEIAMLSPFHFNRVFRDLTGIPPCQFLAALRLEAAKHLLVTTQLSVTDVCFEVGYNSLGTFTTLFTQFVGVPPTRLRRVCEDMLLSDIDTLNDYMVNLPGRVSSEPYLIGHISAPVADPGLIFVGLFSTSIPQGRPVACTLLTAPGIYRMAGVPDGNYHLFAAAFPWFEDPGAYLVPDPTLIWVGAGHARLSVRGGQFKGHTDVTLRPTRLTDPPILVALPVLLREYNSFADPVIN